MKMDNYEEKKVPICDINYFVSHVKMYKSRDVKLKILRKKSQTRKMIFPNSEGQNTKSISKYKL